MFKGLGCWSVHHCCHLPIVVPAASRRGTLEARVREKLNEKQRQTRRYSQVLASFVHLVYIERHAGARALQPAGLAEAYGEHSGVHRTLFHLHWVVIRCLAMGFCLGISLT